MNTELWIPNTVHRIQTMHVEHWTLNTDDGIPNTRHLPRPLTTEPWKLSTTEQCTQLWIPIAHCWTLQIAANIPSHCTVWFNYSRWMLNGATLDLQSARCNLYLIYLLKYWANGGDTRYVPPATASHQQPAQSVGDSVDVSDNDFRDYL